LALLLLLSLLLSLSLSLLLLASSLALAFCIIRAIVSIRAPLAQEVSLPISFLQLFPRQPRRPNSASIG
jgi:hypothetical protein